MIITMDLSVDQSDVNHVIATIAKRELNCQVNVGESLVVVGVIGNVASCYDSIRAEVMGMPGVLDTQRISLRYKLASQKFKATDTIVSVCGVPIGGDNFTYIAGPCAVENEKQVIDTARAVAHSGAQILRGGAFKPRTDPYSFQGLGEDGLKILSAAKAATGLPFVTEVMDPRDVELVARYADMFQIGTRNAQNFPLLTEVGKTGLPVLLKRGFACTLEEWLCASEYILLGHEDKPQVVLCERGIRGGPESEVRFLLDLGVVPSVKNHSHLPVIIDPSHSAGLKSHVIPFSRAAAAIGAHGIIVDVHPDPASAKCDGGQALLPHEYHILADQVHAIVCAMKEAVV